MKQLVFIFSLIIMVSSCNNSEPHFVVDGKVKGGTGKMIYLKKMQNNRLASIDSAVIDEDNSFTLTGKTEKPRFYTLQISPKKSITLVIDKTDEIFIKTNIEHFNKAYTISGSVDSKLIHSLSRKITDSREVIDSLGHTFRENRTNPEIATIKTNLDSIYRETIRNTKEYLIKFIKKHPSSLASLMAIYQKVTPKGRLITTEEHLDLYLQLDSALTKNYPGYDPVQRFHEQVQHAKEMQQKFSTGQPVPDIALPTPQGDTIALSSLKGKYVLLDFWASWCKPCRIENKRLVQLYYKYANKGFDIYQVSLDKNKDAWTQAIQKDRIGRWHHVSDLQFWDSPLVNVYDIKDIPKNFLLDKEGNIIAKDIHGEQLSDKLEEIFTDQQTNTTNN